MKTRNIVGQASRLSPLFTKSETGWEPVLLGLALWLTPLGIIAQSYSIDWHKIAGGGGTSTGATYKVTGTIGQPDAGVTMTGGTYSLTGGFWSLYSVIQTEGAPLLGITQSNGCAILSWSSPSTGYGLEQTPSLSAPSWAGVTNTPADNGTSKSVTLPLQQGNKFFRLKKP